MTTTNAPPPPPPPSAPPPPGVTMEPGAPIRIGRGKVSGVPTPKIVLNAVEGFGKTTIAAYAPSPLIIQVAGETGYATLLGAQRVPEVDTLIGEDGRPTTIESWSQIMSLVDGLIQEPGAYKTLAFDTIGGCERLCHEHVCQTAFGGDWGEKGFSSFQKGYDQSISEWLKFLGHLDTLNSRYGMTILLLCHSKIDQFKNPMGDDFSNFVPGVHHKTWGVTHKWSDVTLFGKSLSVTMEDSKKKGTFKGVGGATRVLYAEGRDAYVAKNRYGMDPQFSLTDKPEESFNIIWSQIDRRKGK